MVVKVGLQAILGDPLLLSRSVTVAGGARVISYDLVIVKSFLNHSNCLLLVTQRRKATECHIICPIETSIVLWMLHALGPVRLRFEILGDLLALRLVLLLRLLVLHQSAIEHVHFVCLLSLLLIHLFDELVKLVSGGLVMLALPVADDIVRL